MIKSIARWVCTATLSTVALGFAGGTARADEFDVDPFFNGSPPDRLLVDPFQGASLRLQGNVDTLVHTFPPDQEIRQLRSLVEIAELQLSQAETALDRQKALIAQGMAAADSLTPLTVKLAEAKAKLEKTKQVLSVAVMVQGLSKPITLQLQNANLGEVVRLIAKMTPLEVAIATGVPSNLTVTTTADGVPLGSALEIIANAVNLEIAAGSDGGLVFMRPGKVQVGGRTIDYKGPAWPWSDDMIFTIQTNYGPIGRRWAHLADLTKLAQTVSQHNALSAWPGMDSMDRNVPTSMGGAEVATVTALGASTLVISEPGSGPKGEKGLWLTLYSVKNGQFKRLSRYFHAGATQSQKAVVKSPGKVGKAGTVKKNRRSR